MSILLAGPARPHRRAHDRPPAAVVCITDFSAMAENASERAARIAAAAGARLQLGYHGPRRDPFLADRLQRLGMRARQLARRFGIHVAAAGGPVRALDALHRLPMQRTLLVLDVGLAGALRRRSGGPAGLPHLASLLRDPGAPLLLVRRDAAAGYRTVAITPAPAPDRAGIDEHGVGEYGADDWPRLLTGQPLRSLTRVRPEDADDADLVLVGCTAPGGPPGLRWLPWRSPQERLLRRVRGDLLLMPDPAPALRRAPGAGSWARRLRPAPCQAVTA